MKEKKLTAEEIGQTIAINIAEEYKPTFISFCTLVFDSNSFLTTKAMPPEQAAEFGKAVDTGDSLKALEIVITHFANNDKTALWRVTGLQRKNKKSLETLLKGATQVIKTSLFKHLSPLAEDILLSVSDPLKRRDVIYKTYSNLKNDVIAFVVEELGRMAETEEPAEQVKLTLIPKSNFTYLPTSKASRELIEISKDIEISLDVGTGKRPVIIDVSVKTPDSEPITPTEREIQEAIGALMQKTQEQHPIFSREQIYKEFAGLPTTATISNKQLDEVERVIDRLSDSKVKIDFTNQVESHNLEDIKNSVITGQVVGAIKREDTKKNGKRDVKYKILYVPPIYFYSSEINQIAKTENLLLCSGTNTGKDRENIDFQILKRVLVKTIEAMKSDRDKAGNYERRRTYEYFYKHALADKEPTPKKARTLKQNLNTLLESLKENKAIKEFKVYKVGRANRGVEIYL